LESYDNVQKICAKNWTRAFFQVPPVELKRDKQKSMKCKALLWPFFPINKEIDVWDSDIPGLYTCTKRVVMGKNTCLFEEKKG